MKSEIKKFFNGDVADDPATLEKYSHDASLFTVRPKIVVSPKNVEDVKNLVKWASGKSGVSLTARSGGTCMSGGPLNESVIIDFSKYLHKIKKITKTNGIVEPGCFYRDFEKKTLAKGVLMPTYTASKEICAVGGMFANNCGGEKSMRYGKAENFIASSKIVLADGEEYEVKPLTEEALQQKIAQGNFEGEIYRKVFDLITENKDLIKSAKPDVSKNSAGYYLWNVYNEEKKIFDLNRLLVGSQGTLGLTTEIEWKLVPVQKAQKMLVIFMDSLQGLGSLVKEILKYSPDSIESYDDYSLKLAIKFFPDFIKQLGVWEAFKLGLRFIPEAFMMLTGGVPKLVIIAEFTGKNDAEILPQVEKLRAKVEELGYKTRIPRRDSGEQKYWKIRHESFNLLRKHVAGKRTAPFIDDIIVKPEYLPEFLPKLTKLLDEYKLTYTVAGHAGNGNFHIIPLMDMHEKKNKEIILELSDKVYDLVLQYKGSITAEHNDGIIRTPYLEKMYAPEVIALFKKVKEIFDPQNIFNPGKKVGGSKEYIKEHIQTG